MILPQVTNASSLHLTPVKLLNLTTITTYYLPPCKNFLSFTHIYRTHVILTF